MIFNKKNKEEFDQEEWQIPPWLKIIIFLFQILRFLFQIFFFYTIYDNIKSSNKCIERPAPTFWLITLYIFSFWGNIFYWSYRKLYNFMNC